MGKIQHVSVGNRLTQADWESDSTHRINGVAYDIVRSHTVVVALAGAGAQAKAEADFVCNGSPTNDDNVTILNAINSLPNSGSGINGTKTGSLIVVGPGDIQMNGLLDFPPLQNAYIDLGNNACFGGGIRLDSSMNCVIRLPLMTGATGGICVEVYPRTAGPDSLTTFIAALVEIYGLAGTNTTGIKVNTAVTGIAKTTIRLFESGGSFTEYWNVPTTELTTNNRFISDLSAHCSAYNNADLTFTNNTETMFTFNSESYDPPGGSANPIAMHSTSSNTERIVIPVPGWYAFGGQVQWAANATGIRRLRIRHNGLTGTSLALVESNNYGASESVTMQINGSYYFAAGDYIVLTGYQNSGGDLSATYVSQFTPRLWVMKVD